MIQKIRLKKPIPSCRILELERVDNEWIYVYGIDTPEEITDEPKKLVVYGHISDLNVKNDEYGDLSINIHFETIDEYMKILEDQRDADIAYRLNWLNNRSKHSINTVVLENRYYNEDELQERMTYLSSILIQDDEKTVFAAV